MKFARPATIVLVAHAVAIHAAPAETPAYQDNVNGSLTLSQNWKTGVGKGVTVTPVGFGGSIVALSSDGWASMLDAATGGIIWKERAGYGFDAPPAVVGNTVIVASQGNKRYLSALSVMSGQTIWKKDLTNVRAGPLPAGGGLVVLESGGLLRSIETGRLGPGWERQLGGACLDKIFAAGDDGDRILACCDDTVYSVNAANGSVVSRLPVYNAAAVLPGGPGEVFTVKRSGEVELRSIESGATSWSTATKASSIYHLARGEEAGLLAVTSGTELFILSANRGELLWDRRFRSPLAGPPLITDTYLAVTTLAGDIELLDPETGTLLFRDELGEPVGTAPTIHDDRLLVTTHEGNIVAFTVDVGEVGEP